MADRVSANEPSRDAGSIDLHAVLAVTLIGTAAAFLPVTRGTIIAYVFGLFLVLFVPGYVIIAALYPDSPRHGSLDNRTRIGLAIPVSLALIPLVIGPLAWTRWGISTGSVVLTLSMVSLGAITIAHLRRRRRPEGERFEMIVPDWQGRVFPDESSDRYRTAAVLFLTFSLVVAAGTLTFALAMPPSPDGTTQFYIGSMGEDGEVVAGDYPRTFDAGVAENVVVGIQNDHPDTMDYTVVVVIEEIDPDASELTVTDRDEIDRLEPGEIVAGDDWIHEHELAIDRTGSNLRVVYLLYVEPPPAEPDPETAEEYLYLNIEVVG